MGQWLKYLPQKLRTRAQFLRGWVNAGDCGSHMEFQPLKEKMVPKRKLVSKASHLAELTMSWIEGSCPQ